MNKFNEFLESIKEYNPILIESISSGYKAMLEDKLPGGLADDKTEADFDPVELERGRKVEMEHTNDKEIAKEIAMDHLTERDDYYDKLEKHVDNHEDDEKEDDKD